MDIITKNGRFKVKIIIFLQSKINCKPAKQVKRNKSILVRKIKK